MRACRLVMGEFDGADANTGGGWDVGGRAGERVGMEDAGGC